jgi:hypothetical protein
LTSIRTLFVRFEENREVIDRFERFSLRWIFSVRFRLFVGLPSNWIPFLHL